MLGSQAGTFFRNANRTLTFCRPVLLQQNSYFHSLNTETDYNICFLRHGQSTWNRANIFIGWTDTPLTEDGVLEARVAGQMLEQSGIQFDEVHTSLLRRSIRTANLALMEMRKYILRHLSTKAVRFLIFFSHLLSRGLVYFQPQVKNTFQFTSTGDSMNEITVI